MHPSYGTPVYTFKDIFAGQGQEELVMIVSEPLFFFSLPASVMFRSVKEAKIYHNFRWSLTKLRGEDP